MNMNAATSFHLQSGYLSSFSGPIFGQQTTVEKKHFAVRDRELSYRFYSHFHPYVTAFSKRLIQKSVRGLQAMDTEYERNSDGTFAILPDSVRVSLTDGSAVTLPDGTRVRLGDGTIAPLPGASLGTTPNGLRLKRPDRTIMDILEGERIALADRLTVLRPNGEPVDLGPATVLILLDSRPRPILFAPLFSPRLYAPNSDVVDPRYPVKDVDFTYSGAYSGYNWELFYHVPIMVAIHLSKNQRFDEAQRWFHYIFDPTDDSDGPTPERFWKVKPFQSTDFKQVEAILVNLATGDDLALQEETVNSIGAWKENPFRPHVIARYRQTAYMLKAVMAYLDNLIAWGDSLFRQDTGEAINEAMQLYVLAANILGVRPQLVPTKGSVKPQTYATLKEKLKESWSVLVDLESAIPFDLAPYPGAGSDDEGLAVLRSVGQTLYFCVPRNDNLLSYWDTVADRLFKIRNSLNFQGIFRQLALFEPPIDPAMLARAAAAGLDVGAIVNGLNQPLPLVRFQLLIQKAAEMCQEVKSLGNNLLSAIEKEDNEAIALLRAQHERVILGMAETVRYSQWQEAIKSREGLEKSLANATQRYVYYERQLGKPENEITIPGLDPLDIAGLERMSFRATEPFIGPRQIEVDIDQTAKGGIKISSHESRELSFLEAAQWLHDGSALMDTLGSGLSLIPQVHAKAQTAGVGADAGFGGVQLSKMASMVASAARGVAGRITYEASKAAKIGGYTRRQQEWAYQSNLAAGEITQTFKQLRAAQIREAIAEREWKNHQQQIRHSEEIERFLNGENTPVGDKKHKKTTTQGFYTWMRREVKGLYGQVFQFAFDIARKAERALQHELGNTELGYLQFGYLAGKEGLLAGEKLYLDIKRMEMAYHDLSQREYELIKHVSLLQVNPMALMQLRVTGSCTVFVPEEVFDMDGPGHYFRRIKNVAVSIPCVTGPYTSVNCTLTLLKSSIRKNSLVGEDGYARNGAEDGRFSDYFGSQQSIVTSTGQNDSGLFETNLRDERFLPFELAGAISEWRLELPAQVRQFDYDSISDVILHLRYTAREGGGLLRNGAVANLVSRIEQAEAGGSIRLFSIRHEFPTEWAKFKSTEIKDAVKTASLSLIFRPQHYPFWSQDRLGTVKKTELIAKTKTPRPVTLTKNEDASGDDNDALNRDPSRDDLLRAVLVKNIPPAPLGPWTLHFTNNAIDDLWVALTWGA
jgi:hypothetical protein